MSVIWDQTIYDKAYKIRIRDPNAPDFGQYVHYGRRFAQRVENPYTDTIDFFLNRVDNMVSHGFTNTARILVVGCGFGYLVEAFKDRGYGNVWGTDISSWIHANKNIESRSDIIPLILNLDPRTASANDWRNATGQRTFDFVVTESVLESYPDLVELNTLLDSLEPLIGIRQKKCIIHIISEGIEGGKQDLSLGLLWQTLEQWVAIRPTHTWISSQTKTVIEGI